MKPEFSPLHDRLDVDRFGIRTLCWRVMDAPQGPMPATAIRADELTRGDGLSPQLDAQALFEYLHFHCIPAPRTVFRGVYRVPAGHALVPAGAQTHVRAVQQSNPEPMGQPSFDSLRREFIGLLEQAVGRALDGTKPACFLSGGTDSSTIAGFIGRVSGQAAATFSIGFEAEGYDEMAYARIAAKAFGTEHHEYYVTPADLVAAIPKVAASFDQPFGNSSAVPAYYCALKAREAGVTRLLAGDGGDELFGGNTRYAKQKVFAAYEQVPSILRKALLEPLLLRTPLGRLPVLKKGASYIRQALIPMPARMHTYNLLERLGVQEVLTQSFLRQVDTVAPAQHQRQVWQGLPERSHLDRMLAYDWRYTLAESDLPKVRGATELAGVGVAFPMLDADLAAFSMRLPDAYKVRGWNLRWFFKEALRGILPPQIITKKKQGFGLPFGVWATRHAELFGLAEDSVQGVVRRGLVRPEFAHQLMHLHLREHPGFYGEMVWILMMLEQWLRAHAPDYQA